MARNGCFFGTKLSGVRHRRTKIAGCSIGAGKNKQPARGIVSGGDDTKPELQVSNIVERAGGQRDQYGHHQPAADIPQ